MGSSEPVASPAPSDSPAEVSPFRVKLGVSEPIACDQGS